MRNDLAPKSERAAACAAAWPPQGGRRERREREAARARARAASRAKRRVSPVEVPLELHPPLLDEGRAADAASAGSVAEITL